MFKRLIQFWHILTVSFVTIIVTAFLAHLGIDPIDIGRFLGARVGLALDVTSSASVPANPFNTLALQLREKEALLDAREQELEQIKTSLSGETDFLRQWLVYLIPLVAALIILVIMNFYFDYKERKLLQKIEEDERKIIEAERRLEKKLDERK